MEEGERSISQLPSDLISMMEAEPNQTNYQLKYANQHLLSWQLDVLYFSGDLNKVSRLCRDRGLCFCENMSPLSHKSLHVS